MDWDSNICLSVDEQVYNAVSVRRFRELLEENLVPGHALVCRNSNEGWLPLQRALPLIAAEVPGFANASPQPPPIPQSPIVEYEEATPQAPAHVPPQPRNVCPYCGSSHIARAEIIYNQGTSITETEPDLVYFDGMSQSIRKVGGGTAVHSIDLARRFAPPAGMPTGCLWPLFLVGCVVTYPFAQPIALAFGTEGNWPGFLLGGGLVVMFVVAALYRMLIHEPQLTEYHKVWGCLQCGQAWK